MNALLDSLAAGFKGDGTRRAALDAALRDGLPGPRSERWKYTPLRALERRTFVQAPEPAAIDPALLAGDMLAGIRAPRLVFVNGAFADDLSDTSGLPDGVELRPLARVLGGEARESNFLERRYDRADEVFARLNAALARDGAVLRIDESVRVEAPIHFVFVGAATGADVAWHARHFIELRRGASATVVEHQFAQGAHANLGNALMHVHLAAGSALRHARVQDEAVGATLFARTDAVLARDADYRRIDLELGAALSRHELNVRLEGEGAELRADGVLFADGRRHVDTRLGIEHIARDTSCSLTWRGLAAGRARAVFHGGIVIREGADGSEAALSNKNLLLSDTAEIDTQPVLEIHADEVKAAHGATVGQLDPTALFYLRSRGIQVADARRLLTAAFCREIVAGVDDETLRVQLDAALDRALARIAA
jgi:Fe-S cluster assembly protein SufD